MLFNSYAFIFLFLPLFLVVWQTVAHLSPRANSLTFVLLCFSILFYALWGIAYLALLATLVCVNYSFGCALATGKQSGGEGPSRLPQRLLLAIAIVVNLLPLLWFKYSWFFIQNLALLLHADWQFTPPGLPLGISFYTFIQIAWLVGVYRGQIQPAGLTRHAAFSTAFPYVISGPIVRYEQIGWQMDRLRPLGAEFLAPGLTLFCIGLAKKVLLADTMGIYADSVFNAAEKNWPLAGGEAWLGSFCYTFQLYFDFSGYTDMAIGLALMAGLKLPENFNSPYKSTGIVDFWRRWHITLSSWLRDFLYIPLGGNRKGKRRQYLNLFLTMLLGGAWHGSGWTFIVWGALHGFMLSVNHFFRASIRESRLQNWLAALPCRVFFIIFTFICIDLCWVVFRALSLDGALAMYKSMFLGPYTMAEAKMPDLPGLFALWLPNHYFDSWRPVGMLALCAAICWLCPNSRQIMSGHAGIFSWRPAAAWAACLATLFFVSLILLTRQSVFLYFKF